MTEELSIQKNLWERARSYFAEVRVEMRRVTWPSKQEIYGTTVMVIFTTFFFAAVFALYDFVFSHGVSSLLSWASHHF